MLRKQLLIAAIAASTTLSANVYAKNISVTDLQELSTIPAVNKQQVIDEQHWLYEVLSDFNKKYSGSILDKRALTRDEAAFILVNLVGRVQENSIDLSDADKALMKVVKKELSKEISKLSGRVAMLEGNVSKLEGRISTLEEKDEKVLRFDYGEDFKITGSLQASFTGNFKEGDDNYPSNFRIPLTEVYVTGKVTPEIDFTINILPNKIFTGTGEEALLADAFLATEVFKNNTVEVGQVLVPIGQEGPMWPITCETVDKAQYTRNYADRMDIGAKLIGSYKHFDYYLGAFNGSGMNATDTNRGMSSAGWLNIRPFSSVDNALSGLEIGSGYYNGNNGSINEKIFGSYIGYNLGKFHARGEYSKIEGYGSENHKADSWYALASYNLTDKIDLVARYDIFDVDTRIGSNSNTEYTYGANYAFAENMKLKLNMVNVSNSAGNNSHRVNVMTQYLF